jgi:hypothetical protein
MKKNVRILLSLTAMSTIVVLSMSGQTSKPAAPTMLRIQLSQAESMPVRPVPPPPAPPKPMPVIPDPVAPELVLPGTVEPAQSGEPVLHRHPIFTNRPPVFTNRPPAFTNRLPMFTNRPPVFTNHPVKFSLSFVQQSKNKL